MGDRFPVPSALCRALTYTPNVIKDEEEPRSNRLHGRERAEGLTSLGHSRLPRGRVPGQTCMLSQDSVTSSGSLASSLSLSSEG